MDFMWSFVLDLTYVLSGILVDCQGAFCSSFPPNNDLELKIYLKISMSSHVKWIIDQREPIIFHAAVVSKSFHYNRQFWHFWNYRPFALKFLPFSDQFFVIVDSRVSFKSRLIALFLTVLKKFDACQPLFTFCRYKFGSVTEIYWISCVCDFCTVPGLLLSFCSSYYWKSCSVAV